MMAGAWQFLGKYLVNWWLDLGFKLAEKWMHKITDDEFEKLMKLIPVLIKPVEAKIVEKSSNEKNTRLIATVRTEWKWMHDRLKLEQQNKDVLNDERGSNTIIS